MTLSQAFVLGIIQGLTEFFPISSSGHLVLSQLYLGVDFSPKDMQGFNTVLHAGTLAALFFVYVRVWWGLFVGALQGKSAQRYAFFLLIVATIPAGIIGVLFEDMIAETFQSVTSVALALAGTGIILFFGEACTQDGTGCLCKYFHRKVTQKDRLTIGSAVFVGLFQAAALVPGFSRSGFTISAARMMGLSRKDALEFSFLMAAPVIAGATILSFMDHMKGALTLPPPTITLVGVVTAFLSSLFAILFLRKFVIERSLTWFVPYLFVVSAALLGAQVVR